MTFTSPQVQAFWWSNSKTDNSNDNGKEEAAKETASHNNNQEQQVPPITLTTQNARHAAAYGLVDEVKHHLQEQDVHDSDENGWTSMHEAARAGHLEVVQTLVEHGANVDARTGTQQDGGTVLFWAKHFWGPEHAVVAYLEDMGAMELGPEL